MSIISPEKRKQMMERASRFRAGGFSPGTDATLGFGVSMSREAGRRQEFAPSSFQALASSGPEDDAGLLTTTHVDDLVEPSFEYFHEESDDDEGQNGSILNGSPPAPPPGSSQERSRASEGRSQVHEHEQELKRLMAHEEAQRREEEQKRVRAEQKRQQLLVNDEAEVLEVKQEQARLLQQQQMLAAMGVKPQQVLLRENPRSAGVLLAHPPSLHQAQGDDHQPEPQQVFLPESQQSQSRALQQSKEPYMPPPPSQAHGPRQTAVISLSLKANGARAQAPGVRRRRISVGGMGEEPPRKVEGHWNPHRRGRAGAAAFSVRSWRSHGRK